MAHTPCVLFVCVHNAGRSQMAAGFLRAMAGDRIEVRTAGSEPADELNPVAVAAMAEIGIDISGERPKPLTDDVVGLSDVVVTMGCGEVCPYFPGISYRDWVLSDPAGQPIEVVRGIRDHLRILIGNLIAELVPVPAR
ncbi:arsenate reductase ArsC [Nocardia caishijiensis]|uniref:Protein-tyrosine-phosphatase n=1 Tax=Nocardia caishijiensis TaxID=184756 RepID=A0ABQ6YLV3_9NOCA|nr:arsenate reductase ArsC [Nocardia caishijiensis]KAF0846461.1 protein-tyrosine-phosphatase [Nocardia caishijiensis]